MNPPSPRFSYLLLNRSLERWFSPDATQLRDDSTRVVEELVEYVASNARTEAQSVVESGAVDGTPQALQQVMISRRLSLQGGFLLVYGGDKRMFASFNAPPESSRVSLRGPLPSLNGEKHRSSDRSRRLSSLPRSETATRWSMLLGRSTR